MPTYEYSCSTCGQLVDIEQKITDKPLTECPACHASTLKRLVSGGIGVILIGDGWAKDSYSKPNK